jgi:hypothetical protein
VCAFSKSERFSFSFLFSFRENSSRQQFGFLSIQSTWARYCCGVFRFARTRLALVFPLLIHSVGPCPFIYFHSHQIRWRRQVACLIFLQIISNRYTAQFVLFGLSLLIPPAQPACAHKDAPEPAVPLEVFFAPCVTMSSVQIYSLTDPTHPGHGFDFAQPVLGSSRQAVHAQFSLFGMRSSVGSSGQPLLRA